MNADYQIARNQYRIWFTKLKSFYYELSPSNFELSDHDSKFGIWLYQNALVTYRGEKTLIELDKLYSAIHISARKLISFKQNQHEIEAEKEFVKLQDMNSEMFVLLKNFEIAYNERLFIYSTDE